MSTYPQGNGTQGYGPQTDRTQGYGPQSHGSQGYGLSWPQEPDAPKGTPGPRAPMQPDVLCKAIRMLRVWIAIATPLGLISLAIIGSIAAEYGAPASLIASLWVAAVTTLVLVGLELWLAVLALRGRRWARVTLVVLLLVGVVEDVVQLFSGTSGFAVLLTIGGAVLAIVIVVRLCSAEVGYYERQVAAYRLATKG
ncbi:hypothetical protein CLV28_0852 [Sediminihabitans luteus]|uniref:Uncharacterized protein n=1 Tax=Sediminihabitans luteus TaxID=1138585 RepID=A0A2M9D0F4_9CELL|nr:hypothetical protein [Sediminihabitans luteus]PJJ77627.1 hypothetical protein CLV28_0852 [Sediminihabitans luteus]GII98527.1 hypothetical protein Slu03_09050 [Sediminihabitans luteus]